MERMSVAGASDIHMHTNPDLLDRIAWLVDELIHGLTNVPYQGIPFTAPAYKAAGIRYMNLCGIQDPSKLDIDQMADCSRMQIHLPAGGINKESIIT